MIPLIFVGNLSFDNFDSFNQGAQFLCAHRRPLRPQLRLCVALLRQLNQVVLVVVEARRSEGQFFLVSGKIFVDVGKLLLVISQRIVESVQRLLESVNRVLVGRFLCCKIGLHVGLRCLKIGFQSFNSCEDVATFEFVVTLWHVEYGLITVTLLLQGRNGGLVESHSAKFGHPHNQGHHTLQQGSASFARHMVPHRRELFFHLRERGNSIRDLLVLFFVLLNKLLPLLSLFVQVFLCGLDIFLIILDVTHLVIPVTRMSSQITFNLFL
mmetsp:Transcript_21517/g.47290  ORF Transcript_21517/g.47290 Transcript_21517/m.47290 type:complete len:268 (-) Transcript_21517:273-1076(-)